MKIKNLIWIIVIPLLFNCNDDAEDLDSAKSTVDKFYKFENENEYKLIDNLISVQFYRVTPYYKFIEFLKNKKQTLGSFKEKHLEFYNVTVSTNSKSYVFLKYKIKYTIKDTEESFLLENNKGVFEIVKYSVD